ncbi:MAG TPA: FtsX-like permease family protein, partial [Trueperaceae bacterium]|nr:FtsX-like permease family protein [Trueperaceae bacterium]
MNFLWKLAFRNLLRHKWRSMATVLGISLGIAAVLATLSVGDNVRANIANTLEASTGKADLLVTPGAQGRAIFNLDDIYDVVAANKNIEKVYPVLNFRAEPKRTIEGFEKSVIPGVDSGFQISGRLTQFPADLPTTLVAGEFPQKGSKAIAIAANFAKDRNIELGDVLEFKANQASDFKLKVVGLLDHTLGYASTNGSRVGVVNLYDLQDILKYKNKASFLELLLKDSVSVEKTKEELGPLVGEKFAVTLPSNSGNITFGIIDTLQASLSILAITLLALGGFMAYNTFAATIVERTKEYALLRTICLTKGQVKILALTESFILSMAGVVVGI